METPDNQRKQQTPLKVLGVCGAAIGVILVGLYWPSNAPKHSERDRSGSGPHPDLIKKTSQGAKSGGKSSLSKGGSSTRGAPASKHTVTASQIVHTLSLKIQTADSGPKCRQTGQMIAQLYAHYRSQLMDSYEGRTVGADYNSVNLLVAALNTLANAAEDKSKSLNLNDAKLTPNTRRAYASSVAGELKMAQSIASKCKGRFSVKLPVS